MCGRYGITLTASEAMRRLGITLNRLSAERAPSYNVAPGTRPMAAIGAIDDTDAIGLDAVRWGFLPSWQTRPSKAVINMRIESADTGYWRKAFTRRRCAIPANWWYEWQQESDRPKQPFAIRPRDADGFFFAGVWSVAKAVPATHALHQQQTFAILTRPAHPDIAAIHPRMPVALSDDAIRAWLAPASDTKHLRAIVDNAGEARYDSWPVSRRVNTPRNDDPSLVTPVESD